MKVSSPLRETRPQFIIDESNREFYIPGYSGGLGSGATLLANRVYAVPIFLERPTTFVKIAVEVLTLAAGVCRLGLYANAVDVNGLNSPGALVTDYGTVDVSSTGVKEIVISETLDRDLHWLGFSSDVAPILQGLTSTPGIIPLSGAAGAAGTGLNNIIRALHAIGENPLPDPFPNHDAIAGPAFCVVWVAPNYYA